MEEEILEPPTKKLKTGINGSEDASLKLKEQSDVNKTPSSKSETQNVEEMTQSSEDKKKLKSKELNLGETKLSRLGGVAGPEGLEFDVIDEFEITDKEEKGSSPADVEDRYHGNEDISDDEDIDIDAMLDAGVAHYKKHRGGQDGEGRGGEASEEPIIKYKTVLKSLGHEPLEPLPEGWIVTTHNCGMPVYLHRETRVVSWSRPYFLGTGSIRKHNIPISSIPCFHYIREKEKKLGPLLCDITTQTHDVTTQGVPHEVKVKTEVRSVCPYNGDESTTSRDVIKSEEDDRSDDVAKVMAGSEESQGHQDGGDSDDISTNGSNHASAPTSDREHAGKPDDITAAVCTSSDDPVSSSETDDVTAPADADGSDQNGGRDAISAATVAMETSSDNGTNHEASASSSATEGTCHSTKGEVKLGQAAKLEVCREESVDADQFRSYLERRFKFDTITIRKFRTWAERRQHNKLMKKKELEDRPTLSSNAKVITLSVPGADSNKPAGQKREFLLNPAGKSSVCILHEYTQRVMRAQPQYQYTECDNAAEPFAATVEIQSIKYGTGTASSKKQAKLKAAKATLEILIPDLYKQNSEAVSEEMEYFDHIGVEDSRVYELCSKAGQLSPYQMLTECLKRNFGMADTDIKFDVAVGKHQKSQYTMTVGKHTVQDWCKNKRIGKQLASQAILQKLHPHIKTWGSLIRMYGRDSSNFLKEKKEEEQSILELTQFSKKNRPNMKIIDKLQAEMRKLKEQRDALTGKRKFNPGNVEKPPNSLLCTLDV
ncbi:PREDICTED: microprocessor complex subunit DGCR8-like [Branchiostoma belcheri]|uniref:Microprocessor complex subunit DGCR8-like n=1 Tax=Branchiostoma belcheri TaxID=7741 RepID=A0A6P4ZCW9_BRABE|nr:PREDICTED: microprocessor complex subunit DGCR8-like [Branchiostoma belcheri]